MKSQDRTDELQDIADERPIPIVFRNKLFIKENGKGEISFDSSLSFSSA